MNWVSTSWPKVKNVRRVIDPGSKRGFDLFQPRLRRLNRCTAHAIDLLPIFAARPSPMRLGTVLKSNDP